VLLFAPGAADAFDCRLDVSQRNLLNCS
jgi:hypothetical protein